MNAETLLADLIHVNLIGSAAVVLVLMLRPFVLPGLGARLTYWLWMLVPIVVLASFLPAPERVVIPPIPSGTFAVETIARSTPAALMDAPPSWGMPVAVFPDASGVLVTAWLLVAGALLARSILNTRRLTRNPMTGPALIGVLRPRLILPEDFVTRFEPQERTLILAHENIHRIARHTLINALVELMRCACWFNPLAHIAAQRIRSDQELACDAAVIAAHPGARHTYAQALLKTQAVTAFLPLGCSWTSRSAERLHERISMLAQPARSRRVLAAGVVAIAAVGLSAGYAAWAQQPERIVVRVEATPAVWTPSAEAPAGVLSHELEGNRHDLFISLAQQGNIDFVLFGTTDAEMFWWPDRGKPVWDRAFADIKAANFGAQGTSLRSLLWRMQNGELDGYQAKLIVLEEGFCLGQSGALAGRAGATRAAVVANCTPVLAQIRARQPQAKILLMPPFPRGFEDRDAWLQIAADNAAASAPLVDDATVFYADFGERFFLQDGSHNNTMWARQGINGVGVGAQTASFEAVAEELQPWLDRFVR